MRSRATIVSEVDTKSVEVITEYERTHPTMNRLFTTLAFLTFSFIEFAGTCSHAQIANKANVSGPNALWATSYSSSRNLPEAPEPAPQAAAAGGGDDFNPVKAVIGLGFHTSQVYPDYALSSNVISSSHIGQVTPQYLLGVAYAIPLNYKHDNTIDCDKEDDNKSIRCHPFSAFVSAKFSQGATDTVNGVSFGVAHKIIPQFSVLFAASLDAYQQPSPGFINAAVQTVTAQQKVNNPYYTTFDPAKMANNSQDAYDGFSTLFITTNKDSTTGALTFTPGSPIYQGNALITNYHFGFLFGVALTPDFKGLLGIK